MSVKLTDIERRRLKRYVKRCRSKGDQPKGSLYNIARAMLALDQGKSPEDVARLLLPSVQKLTKTSPVEPSETPDAPETDPQFEKDLDYILDKNSELYRRLAQ